MRRLASFAALPVLLSGALWAGIACMAHGIAPEQVLLPLFLVSASLVALLERALPFRAEWNRARGDLWTDAAYLPTTWLASIGVQPLSAALATGIGGSLSRTLDSGLWPVHWPVLVQLALAAVVVELPSYWAHRLLHEVPWLWPLHAVHHSAPRLYWLNATRSHPLEIALRGIIGMLPLGIAGASAELIALFGITNLVVGLFQHANIDIRLGPLDWIFSAAPVHRWHHSRERAESNTNYGDNFIFWDTVFGTRHMPAREPPGEVGIGGLDAFPPGYPAQLVAPLRWRAIVRKSAEPAA